MGSQHAQFLHKIKPGKKSENNEGDMGINFHPQLGIYLKLITNKKGKINSLQWSVTEYICHDPGPTPC